MADMINKDILPDALACMKDLSSVAVNKKQLGGGISCEYEESMLKKLSPLSGSLYKEAESGESKRGKSTGIYRHNV